MNISWIREKVRDGQYDLSSHAHQERQEEQITIAEIEKILLKGSISAGRLESFDSMALL